MAAVAGPHGIPVVVYSWGASQDAPLQWQLKKFWLATLDDPAKLVPLSEGVQGIHRLVASGGKMGLGNSSPSTPSFSSPIQRCVFDYKKKKVKFTQLCSRFPPTALLNFACDG